MAHEPRWFPSSKEEPDTWSVYDGMYFAHDIHFERARTSNEHRFLGLPTERRVLHLSELRGELLAEALAGAPSRAYGGESSTHAAPNDGARPGGSFHNHLNAQHKRLLQRRWS